MAQSAHVPVDHWGYRFLERMEILGLFVSEDFAMRPYSRDGFAEAIVQIDTSLKQEMRQLSTAEAGLFEQLKGEFHEELASLRADVAIDEKQHEPHVYSWRSDQAVVSFDATFRQQLHLESRHDVDAGIPTSITSIGFGGRAKLRGGMVIVTDGYSSVLSETDSTTNTAFNPSLGLPVTKKALVDVAISPNATTYMIFRLPWFDLLLGRDLVDWGNGARGNLMLSKNSNVYDMVKLTFRYRRAKFEYVHGFLNSDETRYLVAHRLEMRPWRNFLFSVTESIVYGNRDLEPNYLNPFMIFLIAEPHAGNKDNNMLAFDAAWFLPWQPIKLYWDFAFDDFSFAKDIFGSWGNKWGVLAGLHWVNPLGLDDTELRFEAARIQPFVYSHREAINTYANFNNTIGHWLGPDAADIYLEMAHQPHRNLRWTLSWETRWRGQNDVTFGTRPADGRTTFLGGNVERVRHYGLSADWQMRRDIWISASYNYLQSANLRRDPDLDQDNHRLFLRFSANY